MSNLNRLSAADLAGRIASGDVTAEQAVRDCLARIEARDSAVGAWQLLNPEAAIAEARARDRETPRGPLHGVPIGVKDIIDTTGMLTEYGSVIYRGHRPAVDAACVARARSAGAVILGKTVTTEFATYQPAKTTNPRNTTHTPGGSSSGSAAAVADCMAPLALGSQTVGSVIRPASYCGVVGFKASYGRFGLTGVKELARGLDTLGFFARSVEDIALFTAAIGTRPPPDVGKVEADLPCRIGLVRTPQWSLAQRESQEAVEAAAAALAAAGHRVADIDLPSNFEGLIDVHQTVFVYRAVRALADEWRNHRHQLGEKLHALLEEGEACSTKRYRDAETKAQQCRAALDAVFSDVDLLLTPSAQGEAPAGLESTGDPIFNRMWTLLHVPCVTLPGYRGPLGLPVGIQFIGARGCDDALLARTAALSGHLPGNGRTEPPIA